MSLRMEFTGYKGTGPRIRVRRRAELGRRLTRRLSMVAKVPAAFLQRNNQPDPRPIDITAIAPDMTQLTLGAVSPGPVSALVAPVLLKYRVCRPRLLLAGSRAEVDPAADVALLHGEVLLIEDAARQYNPTGDTDKRYRATEKLLHAEDEYRETLRSSKELYGRPLARNHPEQYEILFKLLDDLARVSADFCERLEKTLDNWNPDTFKLGELFPASFWSAYWKYLERYVEARRTLEELEATQDPLLAFLRLRQAAARHSPSSLLLLPIVEELSRGGYVYRRGSPIRNGAVLFACVENSSLRACPARLKNFPDGRIVERGEHYHSKVDNSSLARTRKAMEYITQLARFSNHPSNVIFAKANLSYADIIPDMRTPKMVDMEVRAIRRDANDFRNHRGRCYTCQIRPKEVKCTPCNHVCICKECAACADYFIKRDEEFNAICPVCKKQLYDFK